MPGSSAGQTWGRGPQAAGKGLAMTASCREPVQSGGQAGARPDECSTRITLALRGELTQEAVSRAGAARGHGLNG